MSNSKSKRKPKASIKPTPPVIGEFNYPFINPIIVSKDRNIIDGQHRYKVCQLQNREVEYIEIDYNSDELQKTECVELIKGIKKSQSIKLEEYFKKYQVGYKSQIDFCSSDDKIPLFYSYRNKLKTDIEYWKTLKEAYTLSSNNFQYQKELIELFTSEKSNKQYLMSEEERNILNRMPSRIKIFRGMTVDEYKNGIFGISWTLEKEIAQKFASTYIHNYATHEIPKTIKELTINKNEVIAYFSERNEEEIIYIHPIHKTTV